METESPAASEDLRHHHRHSQQNHSRHSSGGENNNVNNNNNNNNNNSHPVEPDLSSEDGDFGSADEIGSEEASAWIARASRSLCEDSQGAPAGIDLDGGAMGVGVVAGGGGGGGVGVGGGGAGSSPPLQGEVNVTLWQFLLELLMSRQYSHVIQWTNREGEFQLLRAEEVARLWGMRKNKNHRMNYDKLSRALRYYYQKNIIKKVQGQKFVYRFVGLSDSVLRAPRSMGSAAAAAAAAAAAIATPPDGVSPKLEAVEDDLPASPQMEEPATIQAPLLFQPTQQQQQQKSQSLTPPPQPSALNNARRLWQGSQQLYQQHHHIQHHQQLQQHQGLDLSLPHAAAAAAALIASSAASPPPPPPPLAPSKRLRTPESASATRSPESPPAKRPCCACRCHESQAESTATTAAAMAAVSTPRIKTEPTAAAAAAAAAPAEAEDPADSGSLPSSYIQWLTLELAGGAGGIGGGGGGSGGGGPSFLHSSRHAANMKKLAEHIRLQKIFKRPPPPPPASEPVATLSTAATSSPSSMSHGLSHAHPHPHPAVSQPPPHPGPGLASSFGQSNGSPFSPPGCVWMPVPVAMLSQLWAGHEAAAAAVAAASAAAAAAAVAAAPSSCSSTSGGGGGCGGDAKDHGD